MSIITAKTIQEAFPEIPTDLPEEDDIPLESDWHRVEMNLLIDLVILHNHGREDFFVGGNMFIYFDVQQARNRNFRGPDFFYVSGVSLNPSRGSWRIWDEGGRYPDVIIELTSPSTADVDHGVKKEVYERTFRTPEYFIYDPDTETLQGWRLGENSRYHVIKPNEKGWLWCEQLGVWLGTWKGKFQGKENIYLRFYDKDYNLVANYEERALAENERAEAEKERADIEKQRAEVYKERAQAELERAEAEKRRADEAEAELARLKKQIEP